MKARESALTRREVWFVQISSGPYFVSTIVLVKWNEAVLLIPAFTLPFIYHGAHRQRISTRPRLRPPNVSCIRPSTENSSSPPSPGERSWASFIGPDLGCTFQTEADITGAALKIFTIEHYEPAPRPSSTYVQHALEAAAASMKVYAPFLD
jgi:hypothetical protein